ANLPGSPAQRPRRPEMDRARHPGVARPRRLRTHSGGRGGGALTDGRSRGVVLMLVAGVVACGSFGPGGLNRVIAIEVSPPDSHEGVDTLTRGPRVLDGD